MPDVDSLGAGLLEILRQDHPACRIFAARRERRHFFDETFFGEPAWDMLLLLCCAAASGRRVSHDILASSSGVPASVALRWLAILQTQGLVVRRHGAGNLLFQTIELTDAGRSKMEDYLNQADLMP